MTELPPEIETQAARLRCTTLRYLNIGARGQPPADWHWIYVPEKRYPFYRVNVFSTAMPSMAPAGVRVDLRRDGRPRPDRRRDRARHGGGAGRGGRAARRRTTSCSPSAKQIEYAYVVFDQHYYEATRIIFAFLEQNAIHPRGPLRRVDVQRDGGLRAGGARGGGADRSARGSGGATVSDAPHVSIVIPVYNEEGILRGSVLELQEKLRRFGWSYELLLCENGSRDRTVEIGKELRGRAPARCACCRSASRTTAWR